MKNDDGLNSNLLIHVRNQSNTASVATDVGSNYGPLDGQDVVPSPSNGKKAGKFTRMMKWVDKKLCGSAVGAQGNGAGN